MDYYIQDLKIYVLLGQWVSYLYFNGHTCVKNVGMSHVIILNTFFYALLCNCACQ